MASNRSLPLRDDLVPDRVLPQHVLHLVGVVTVEVLSFLAPATHVLARCGVSQQVLAVGAAVDRSAQWGLALAVQVEVLPAERNPLKRWLRAAAALRAQLQPGESAVLHVHGLVPALVGSLVALLVWRRKGNRLPLVYTPHGSRSLGAAWPAGVWLHLLARPLIRALPIVSVIASHAVESQRLLAQTNAPVHLAESPTPAAYLAAVRAEAPLPLIVAGVLEKPAHAARQVARLAVLLGDDLLHAKVEWIGVSDDASAALLRATGVASCGELDAEMQAARLASAWIHVAPTASTHFPALLARAMAMGLPCVALDVPFHRALIVHGVDGYLCADVDAMVQWTFALVESSALREQIGQAARASCHLRFGEKRFGQSLLAAYSGAVTDAVSAAASAAAADNAPLHA